MNTKVSCGLTDRVEELRLDFHSILRHFHKHISPKAKGLLTLQNYLNTDSLQSAKYTIMCDIAGYYATGKTIIYYHRNRHPASQLSTAILWIYICYKVDKVDICEGLLNEKIRGAASFYYTIL